MKTSPDHSVSISNARVLTLDSVIAGTDHSNPLGAIPLADVLIERGIITQIIPHASAGANAPGSTISLPHTPAAPTIHLDARGGLVLPSFVDCHTHLCWAGSRLDEWERKLAGTSYLDILAAGGGIMSTVRAVRAADRSELADLTLHRLHAALELGTTTIEIKSGYGLTTEHELKMLRAITDVAARWPGTVVPTALLGHAIDPDASSPAAFVDSVINHTLPAIHAEFPGIAVDAYCEQGAWSVADCVRFFDRARSLGHPVRVHTDQFNSLGMINEAIRLGAVSVDHLEATPPTEWDRLAESDVAGVILPCCGFHLDNRYAKPIDAFTRTPPGWLDRDHPSLCIATNSNPGSAPCISMPMALGLAVRQCGVPIPRAVYAATRAPARLLGLHDRGIIQVGSRADVLVLNTADERELAYRFGDASILRAVVAGGRVVVNRPI